MKSAKYIIISLFIGFTTKSYACWSPTYTPGEYYVFYACDPNNPPVTQTTTELNITEWQQYTSGQAIYDDIRDVVYGYDLEALERIGGPHFNDHDTLYHNTFVKYLVDHKDHEAINYLILAKKCEIRRGYRNDKWWYPTKDDLESVDLQEIIDEALTYKGSKLNVRYWLQAMRAAFSMKNYDLCLQLWNDHIKNQPSSSIRTMCEDYIGGIYFQKGDYDTAIQHYANTLQSSDSFWWCVDHVTGVNSDIERIRTLYQYCPTSPELAVMVQKICREAEKRANSIVFDGIDKDQYCDDRTSYKAYVANRKRYITLRNFALQAASEKRSDNPAMWQYAASFLTLIDGSTAQASEYLADAQQMKGSSFVQNNIKILRIIIDAINGSYDAAFEARMLPQLRWLNGMIENNLPEEVKQRYLEYENSLFSNYSMYYYNDMMRKIILSVMAPRYLEKGQDVKAMLLAGMASERLRIVTDYRRNRRDYNPNWNIDFYTDVFSMIDTLSVNSVIAYRNTLQKGGNGAFECFLAAKCYKNNDYFNEIIGTKYMRTEQFDKAKEYLSKVTVDYDTTLNIFEYFKYDPFQEPYLRRKYINPSPGYKLSFATRMLDLQKVINVAQSQETKAEAMHQYALGLMRATEDCWPLMRYKIGDMFTSDQFADWGDKMSIHYYDLLDNAINLSANPELKAKCLTAKAWNTVNDRYEYALNKKGEWEKVVNPTYHNVFSLLTSNYQGTNMYRHLRSECDSFYAYTNEEK